MVCSETTRSCPSSSAASSSSVSVGGGEVADPMMVKEELEAAEALADLAHLAMRENSGAESAGNWGLKGKRAKKRVKSESPPTLSGSNPVPACPDLPQVGLSTLFYIMYLFLFLSFFLWTYCKQKEVAVCPELVNSHYSTK